MGDRAALVLLFSCLHRLYRNPDIMVTDGNEIKINFYNNDYTKKFRVVLEGITTDGRLISFEKIIE